jgi:hypothetical protein
MECTTEEEERMMQQTAAQQQMAKKFAHPKRLDIFLHFIKTTRLLKDLLLDRRVPVLRKLLFLGSIGALVVVLFFPDLLGEAILSTILPIAGTVLGVPLDAGFDWITFALIVVSLLRYFPADVVSEHYQNIFHRM